MKFAMSGATGKMGKEIREIAALNKKLKYVVGFSSRDSQLDHCVSHLSDMGSGFDVLIDFSNAEVFSDVLSYAVNIKKPLLSGTTGLSAGQKKQIEKASQRIPILWSPNTAPGVHIVKNILQKLMIPESFDVQLTEYHHIAKKDKPSGTAILLQEQLHQGKKKIPEPISIRGGGIYGIHRIELMSQGELITIEHQALGRKVFAQGALDAAAWLTTKKSGLYTMDDFLKNYK